MTDPLAPRMRWWGWGIDGHDAPLPKAAAALLRDELGAGDAPGAPAVALDRVELPDPALGAESRARLAAVVGVEHVRDDRLARVAHAAGRSYPDLVRLRRGRGLVAPDAVVYPGGHDEVAEVLAVCAQEAVAVIAFGGGTSVVGGVEPLRGPFAAAVSLDLARMSGLRALDVRSQLATFAAGTTGPEVERLLGAHGLTLGHFPQSFEFSTVGGWAATRSAGQASSGYGRIDELVVALRATTPSGELATLPVPASAAGPDLRALLLGSEGVLGVITEVTLRVRPRPRRQRYDAYSLPGFAAGTDALRALEQAGAAPDVVRLSDEEETRLSLALASHPAAARLLRAYMRGRGRGHPKGCMTILGFDGEPSQVARRRTRARSILRRHGAIALGPAPGAAWAKGRFHGAYVRDELLRRGVLVDTLETATTWTALATLHSDVGAALHGALARRGTPAVVMCHVSHLYPTGASLYFTFLARQEGGAELEQWQAAKTAASEAISSAGATITHHHAVGRDHAPWLAGEIGELGIATLRAVKARVDPVGIMNPGKLLP
ncbi:MAG: alkyldihydroxyacetonephosphate synthase [Solirubrobacteraceae bacterium]|nr:alkyldihydroxyacetonephosphate synthase [Solirubrobacteraceae bacterium]